MDTRKLELVVPSDRVAEIYRVVASWLEEAAEDPEPEVSAAKAAACWSTDDGELARFIRNNSRPLGRRIVDFIAEKSAETGRPGLWAWFDDEREYWSIEDPGHGERIPLVRVAEIVDAVGTGEQAVSGALSAISRLCRKVGRPAPFNTTRGAVSPAGDFFTSDESIPAGTTTETFYWLEPAAAEVFRAVRK